MKIRKTRKLLRELREEDRKKIERILSLGTALPWPLRSYQVPVEEFLGLRCKEYVEGQIIVNPDFGGAWELRKNYRPGVDQYIEYSDSWDLPSGRLQNSHHSFGFTTSAGNERLATPSEIEKLDRSPDLQISVPFAWALVMEKFMPHLLSTHNCSYRYLRSIGELLPADYDVDSALKKEDVVIAPSISEFIRIMEREFGIYLSILYFTVIHEEYKLKYRISRGGSSSKEIETEFPGTEIPMLVATIDAIPHMIKMAMGE